MTKRGIIIGPNVLFTKNGFYSRGGTRLDPLFLRKCLTYWDKIDFPQNNLIGFGSDNPNDDLVFLESTGILKRTMVLFPIPTILTIDGKTFIEAQITTLEKYHREHPTETWSISQLSSDGFSDGENNNNVKEQLIFELCDALPVPAEDTPLNDILEFKEKRKSELRALQGTIDDLYGEILKSGLDRIIQNRSTEKITTAIQDLNKVMNEQSFTKRLLKQFDINLNVGDLLAGLGTYLATGPTFSILGVIGCLKITKGLIPKKLQLPDHLKSYAYLMRMEKELGPTIKREETLVV